MESDEHLFSDALRAFVALSEFDAQLLDRLLALEQVVPRGHQLLGERSQPTLGRLPAQKEHCQHTLLSGDPLH